MSCELFKYGSMYLDEFELSVPKRPMVKGDIPRFCGEVRTSIRAAMLRGR